MVLARIASWPIVDARFSAALLSTAVLLLSACDRAHENIYGGGGMIPTIMPESVVEWVSHPGPFERGDLVVFTVRQNNQIHGHVQRVLGLPGDRVSIREEGFLINGELITSEALCGDCDVDLSMASGRDRKLVGVDYICGDDEYFLIGDNQPQARDSRYTGPVSAENILGIVRAVKEPE